MRYTVLALSLFAAFANQGIADEVKATYQLTELSPSTYSTTKHTAVLDVNDAGEWVGVGEKRAGNDLKTDVTFSFKHGPLSADDLSTDGGLYRLYDIYKDTRTLDGKDVTFTLENLKTKWSSDGEALKFILSFLNDRSRDPEYLKISDRVPLFSQGQQVDTLSLPGQASSLLSLNAMTNNGVKAGWFAAPYEAITKGDKEYFTRLFDSHAFILTDQQVLKVLKPTPGRDDKADEANGISKIHQIIQDDNGDYLAVGQVSVGISKQGQRILDDCIESAKDDNSRPVYSCLSLSYSNIYHLRAYRWQLDEHFNLMEAGTGNLDQAHVIPNRVEGGTTSNAIAINKHGVAVGESMIPYDEDGIYPYVQPGYFMENQFHLIPWDDKGTTKPEHDTSFGRAIDINDDGWILGYRGYMSHSSEKKVRSFIYNYHDKRYQELGVTQNNLDYRLKAVDINNRGDIIAQGYQRDSLDNRSDVFLYQAGDYDTPIDIQELLSCEQQEKYHVEEVMRITEAGDIYAMALIRQDTTDRYGKLVKNVNGEVEKESIKTAVRLQPLSGGSYQKMYVLTLMMH